MAEEGKIRKEKSLKLKKERKIKQKEKIQQPNESKKMLDGSLFNIKDIITLGGKQADYESLLQIDVDEDLETADTTTDGDHTDKELKNEIETYMKSMGLESFAEEKNNNVKKDLEPANIVKKNKKRSQKIPTLVEKEEVNEVPPAKKKKKNEKNPTLEVKKVIEVPLSKKKKKKSEKNPTLEVKKVIEVPLLKKKKKKGVENLPTLENEVKEEEPVVETQKIVEKLEFKCLAYKKYDRLLLKNATPWYESTSAIPKCKSALGNVDIESLYKVANQYWEAETDMYQKIKEGDRSSDAKWLRTVLTSGTLSDRVAALTMLSQESPIHGMQVLQQLITMSKKKARREALVAIDSLRHIWVADLLPDYKLRKFNEFPLEKLDEYVKSNSNSHDEKVKLLITIIFENNLKKIYKEFVGILDTFSRDALVDIRNKVLGIVYELLSMKPEGEQVLLSILVNKLGDPERKVAAKTSFLLCELVTKHPNMKAIVITEVERMMYRPNMSDKAQYYAICFLNQIVLSHEEKAIASKLVSIYFSFFKVIAKRDTVQTKLLSGLLTGVNRAYPYVEGMDETYDDQLNTLFKLSHSKHLRTSVSAFMLIYQVMESRQTVSDRYYKALYDKVLHPDICKSTKHTMFLNLLFKSLKNDPVTKRVKSFIKRLLQTSSQNDPSLLCGILFLISEVIKGKPGINSMMLQAEELDEEEHFVDAVPEGETNEKLEDDEECENKDVDFKKETPTEAGKGKASWTFQKADAIIGYNIRHRDPLYAKAEETCLWEILPLLSHFHPSVTHFATSVVNGKEIGYQGDPSEDFTLTSFLERFMYRNPKQKDVTHGHSLMQRKETSQRLKEQPVNSKHFLQKSEENVPHDQVFFYRFFKAKMMDQVKEEDKDKEEDEVEVEDEVDDIDFAGEIKRDGEEKKKLKGVKRSKRHTEGATEGDEESDEETESAFNYDDMEDDSSDDELDDGDLPAKKTNFSDKDYEKALLDNLDSDGESLDGENQEDNNEDEDDGMDPMFAAAEEFSHMLETGNDTTTDGVHFKQRAWEEKQEHKPWQVNREERQEHKPWQVNRKTNNNYATKGKRNFSSGNKNARDGKRRASGDSHTTAKKNFTNNKFKRSK